MGESESEVRRLIDIDINWQTKVDKSAELRVQKRYTDEGDEYNRVDG